MRTKGKAKPRPLCSLHGSCIPTNDAVVFHDLDDQTLGPTTIQPPTVPSPALSTSTCNTLPMHSSPQSTTVSFSNNNMYASHQDNENLASTCSTISTMPLGQSIHTFKTYLPSLSHSLNAIPELHSSYVPTVLTHSQNRALAVLRYRHKRLIRKKAHLNRTTCVSLPSTASISQSSSAFETQQASSLSNKKKQKPKRYVREKNAPMCTEYLSFIRESPAILESVLDCQHCGAKKFPHETANMCCSDGDVTLVQNPIPNRLRDLLLTPCPTESRSFRVMIRAYNNHLAFTSLGIKYDKKLAKRNKGVYTFRVQGQVYHWLNDLEIAQDVPNNLQFYYHDTDYELSARMSMCPDLDKQTLHLLLEILGVNPYARFFRTLSTIPCLDDHQIILKHNPAVNSKTYNKPTVSQVAVLLAIDETSTDVSHRDIRVYKHSGESKTIQYYFGCYDPLQYPLMFPYGEPGWHQGILRNGVKKRKRGRSSLSTNSTFTCPDFFSDVDHMLRTEEEGKYRRMLDSYVVLLVYYLIALPTFTAAAACHDEHSFVSLREYYSYKFQIRDKDESHILRFGRLFQQYCVDMYVKLETQRLDFFRAKAKQEEVRQEFLQGIVDAVGSGENEASKIGQRILLPASFIGGPRHMRRKYVDAMTLVQKFGKPDIFLTITCNPNWPEIKAHLLPAEITQDRPDLSARIFLLRMDFMVLYDVIS